MDSRCDRGGFSRVDEFVINRFTETKTDVSRM